MLFYISLQTPRDVTGAGGCNLPRMSASVTLPCYQRCERGHPRLNTVVYHTTDSLQGATTTRVVHFSRVCAHASRPRSCADPGDRLKEGELQTHLERIEENGLEDSICDENPRICRFRGVLALSLSRYPRFRKSECEFCMRTACVRKRREGGLFVADKLLACFPLYLIPPLTSLSIA
jgi:hypothetical protein